jgi:tRNA(Ile)-lysidine synthase
MSLLKEFKDHWTANQFSQPGQKFLLAVSGGSDSMVMAHLFLESKIPFGVAHCNFGLRAEASDGDEQFVRDWCAANSIPCHSVRFDTNEKKLEWKKGTQETARILRYEWFEEIRETNGYAKIVTAHHANDNVETLLINLFKGTGISGLHGILPCNGNLIRPLLFADKTAILAYINGEKIQFREDASNETDDYLRNAVRHKVIPVVSELFPNAVNHVNDSITRFAQVEQLYRKEIAREKKKLIEKRGQDYYIPVRKIRHRETLATLCYELLHPFGFTSGQVPDALKLLDAETGKYISSSTHRLIRNRDFLVITALPDDVADLILIEGTPCHIETGRYSYSFSIQDKPKDIPASPNEAYIDLKGITFPVILRKWKIGDYFYPLGMNMKKKKVSRLLIDQKVPLHEKEEVRIVECNKRIAWVTGIRIDERFKVKDTTEKVLVIKRSRK